MFWDSLRKTTAHVDLRYGHGPDQTLIANHFCVRAGDRFDVSIDLTPSLHRASKSGSIYVEARRLADGMLAELKSVTVDDHQVLERIRDEISGLEREPTSWRLRVECEGAHWFVVRPAWSKRHSYEALRLDVLASTDAASCEPRDDED